MIRPRYQGDAFLAGFRAPLADGSVRIGWLGQGGFLIRFESRHLLIDPYLSDSLTKKYAGTDKPHVRMTELVIAPDRLDFSDLVTSSHNHTDHLDAETLGPLLRVNPGLRLVCPEANRAFAASRLGVDPASLICLDDGVSTEAAGFTIHGVPAAHEQVDRDEAGRCRYLGYVFRFGDWTIYHSGDSMFVDEVREKTAPFRPDVALLPINGTAPERRVAGNMNGQEAASLAKAVGAGTVIPCHYEMFEFNTASPAGFVAECERIGQPYRVLACGEWTDFR